MTNKTNFYDVAIVGAGVIGCAMARHFTLRGARVLVLEKAADVLDGASKANSAILHTGFDATPGTVEAACVKRGYAEYLAIHQSLGLPVDRCGAMVLAWTDDQKARLPILMDQARENGVEDIEALDAKSVLTIEPHLSPAVLGGFRVPGEYLIDPWSAPHAYLLQSLLNGADLLCSCQVLSGEKGGDGWALRTSRGVYHAGVVINCAGLYGDHLEQALLGQTAFQIKPRKGQFVVLDKSAAALVGHILLPVPSATTKGIVVCRTAFGNVLIGPTAEEQEDRQNAGLDQETLQTLVEKGTEIIPALADHPVTAVYAGLRPASEEKDYRIQCHGDHRYIAVGGIRSTGLSSALGTAAHVYDLYERAFSPQSQSLVDPKIPQSQNISEFLPRRWQAPDNGGIVCHCERVSRAEIEHALDGPLAANSLAGLKRRTRVTMGRCQGFYCSAALAKMTQGRLAEPMFPDGQIPDGQAPDGCGESSA